MESHSAGNIDAIAGLPDLMRLRWARPMCDVVNRVGGFHYAFRFAQILQSIKSQPGALASLDRQYDLNMVAGFIMAFLFGWKGFGGAAWTLGNEISASNVYEFLLRDADKSNMEIIDRVFREAWLVVGKKFIGMGGFDRWMIFGC